MNDQLIAAADTLYRREANLARELVQASVYHRATRPIRAKLASVRSELDRIEQKIARAALNADTTPVAPEDAVLRAIEGECALTFEYEDGSGNITDRIVSPYEVYQGGGAELVRGFDHDRDALRSFRLDRIAGTPELAVATDYVYPVE